jgi:hypothetical protein
MHMVGAQRINGYEKDIWARNRFCHRAASDTTSRYATKEETKDNSDHQS